MCTLDEFGDGRKEVCGVKSGDDVLKLDLRKTRVDCKEMGSR